MDKKISLTLSCVCGCVIYFCDDFCCDGSCCGLSDVCVNDVCENVCENGCESEHYVSGVYGDDVCDIY